MMGRLSGTQAQLFYTFRLEDRVPSIHLLRQIDAVLGFGDLAICAVCWRRFTVIHRSTLN